MRDADVLLDVHDSVDVLWSKFAAAGLDDKDLVLLSCKQTNFFFLDDSIDHGS